MRHGSRVHPPTFSIVLLIGPSDGADRHRLLRHVQYHHPGPAEIYAVRTTQTEAAALVGVASRTVRRWMEGVRKPRLPSTGSRRSPGPRVRWRTRWSARWGRQAPLLPSSWYTAETGTCHPGPGSGRQVATCPGPSCRRASTRRAVRLLRPRCLSPLARIPSRFRNPQNRLGSRSCGEDGLALVRRVAERRPGVQLVAYDRAAYRRWLESRPDSDVLRTVWTASQAVKKIRLFRITSIIAAGTTQRHWSDYRCC
jgi:hypothetical protein